MSVPLIHDAVEVLSRLCREGPDLSFRILEIGARPVEGATDPAEVVLGAWPGSQRVAVEVDEALCRDLNARAPQSVRWVAACLGRAAEERPLYETAHPACFSLYRPNEALLARYQNLMHMMALRSVGSVRTETLDDFAARCDVGPVDLIQIDVQGAELDIFRGGGETLRPVVAIVAEVAFLPLYEGQPLFGEVQAFLAGQGFQFHRFLKTYSRTLQPVVLGGDPNRGTQDLWADALFVRDLWEGGVDSPDQLVKLGVLAYLYGSIDLTVHCLRAYDELAGSEVLAAFMILCGGDATPEAVQ